MPESKKLNHLLRQANIVSSTPEQVQSQLQQRAAYNMNNYLRLMMHRLDQVMDVNEESEDRVKQLLSFIARNND